MTKLRVLLAHDYYQRPGGEDVAFENEVELLRRRGHPVETYVRRNEELEEISDLGAAIAAVWSAQSKRELEALIRWFKPDVLHFHNTFPLISPAAYYAASGPGIQVIQTLHNYRLTCPAATHFRDGGICEDCLGKAVPWPAVLHGCYRESRPQNLVVAAMLSSHKAIGTFSHHVNIYVAVSRTMEEVLIRGGVPRERIRLKANFMHDPGVGQGPREGALFVGRLAEEKGVLTILEAWEELRGIPLTILGGGPLEGRIRREIRERRLEMVEVKGHVPHGEVLESLRTARLLLAPSLSYEGLPTTVIEAFGCGTPAVVSNRGATAEMVEDGRDGLTIPPGEARKLAMAVRQICEDEDLGRRLGRAARRKYERAYSPENNYEQLMAIYLEAREGAS